ncbi:MAG TPA: hypothetical protein VFI99_13295 [Nocardioides sp.]|nr:hypothetical protein [Nocardioides sp.]
MRRALAAFLSACLAAFALLAVSPSAQAADPITGRLVNGHAGTPAPAVAGMTVELVESATGPTGAAVASAVTDADGLFSLDPGTSTAAKFFVRAVAGEYQAGWVGGNPRWLQRDSAFANKFVPGTDLGNVRAIPAFIRGVVVNSVTKKPLAGVTVTARSQDAIKEVDGIDETNAEGVFRINGLTCEDDCYLKINGSAKGYETGFRDCNAQVVATWPAACASPLGRIGRVFLDRL